MFKKAERKRVKLKLAITGPSGSGKTYSALRLATGIGGKIAVIDTENGSASLYSDRFNFDVLELSAPYSVEKYSQAIRNAVEAGYDIVIIDSISHQWRGEGGILNKKEQLDSRGGNSFTNWAKLTPEQEKFVAELLHSNIHLIATIRSKQEYAMSQDEKGKARVQKMGLAPIQREGMEYEFTTVFDVGMNHEAETSKDRTGLFADKIFKITEETGKEIKAWVDSGVEAKPVVEEDEKPYVVPFGNTDIKGKTLEEAGVDVLVKYIMDLEEHVKKTKKPLAPKYMQFVEYANEYISMKTIGSQDNDKDAPKLDEDENLPF